MTNDSAMAHLSEAVGTPAGVLFGPTTESFGFSPHLKTSRSFSADVGCRPCSKHGHIPCRYQYKRCFYDICEEEVVSFLYRHTKSRALTDMGSQDVTVKRHNDFFVKERKSL